MSRKVYNLVSSLDDPSDDEIPNVSIEVTEAQTFNMPNEIPPTNYLYLTKEIELSCVNNS